MKGQQKWMKAAQWQIADKVRFTVDVPYNWHRAHPQKPKGRFSKRLLALLLLFAFVLGGCKQQIDRLTGGGSENGDTHAETCAKYPWTCPETYPGSPSYHYSDDFCHKFPTTDVCAGR